jgi:Cu(I)/Ag(I) efflux system membrane fusion protein
VGEDVVSHGAFKIDSALQIQAKTSMMNPRDGSSPTGHRHGASPSPTASGKAAAAQPLDGVPSAFRSQLETFLLLYFQVADGLSHDDLPQARQAAEDIPAALRAANAALLTGMASDMWDSLRNDVIRASESFADANDMNQARNEFYDLSERTIHLVRLMGASGDTSVYVYHCPMARDGAGADWLQASEGVENPYYGSQMFRCGERTETLVESTDPESGQHEE